MPPRKKKTAANTTGLTASEVAASDAPREITDLVSLIESAGGAELARYREPLGGHWVVFAALPIEKVAATPFQRELSESHVKRLATVMPKVGRFLDPVIAVANEDGFWTPNGMHRLASMRELGAKTIVALVLPEREIAFRILALNTEKAHNVKDKSLEAMRMLRALAEAPDTRGRAENEWAFEFEEPAYPTLGLCYDARPRFAGGAYMPVLKRCETFSEEPVAKALEARGERAKQILELDDAVAETVEKMKAAGLKSPYLKAFVIARINPLRFVKAAKVGEEAPRASFETTFGRMLASLRKLDVSKIRPQDLAVMAGAPAEE